MIDKSVGIRPAGQSLSLRRNRGFSLVEIMMSIVLIAIGTALAIPSYQDMIEKRQVTNGAEQLASFVNMAQGAAMKTNQVVTVSYSFTNSNDWCIGAVESEVPCNCTVDSEDTDGYCAIGSQKAILNDSIASERGLVQQMTGDGAYAFDPIRGMFTERGDALTMDVPSRSGDFRLKLMVNDTGRVTLCSDGADYAVPGYELCRMVADINLVEATL